MDGYLHRRRLRLRSRRREVKFRRVHRGQRDVRRMDRHHYGLVRRSSLWVLPAIKGAIKRSGRSLALYGGVTVLKLRSRGLEASAICDGNGTGGEDIWIEKPRAETHGAAMDNGRGSGQAIDI
eukprot:scaffold4145_cov115-Isochrysis_galbana.AAC.27